MYSLDAEEALRVSSVFLSSLYSAEIYARWVELKRRLMFSSEKEFVTWMLDCIDSMQQQQDMEQQSTSGYGEVDEGGEEEEQYYATDNLDESVDDDVLEDKNIIIACDIKQEPPSTQTVTNLTSSITTPATNSSHTDSIISTTPSRDDGLLLREPDYITDTQHHSSTDGSASPFQNYNLRKSAHTPELHAAAGRAISDQDSSSDVAVILEGEVGAGDSCTSCPYCNKVLASRGSLQHHVNTIHYGIKSIECTHCQYKCAKKQDLKKHYVYKHGYATSIQCHHCRKYFFDSNKLNIHLRGQCGK